MFDVKRFIERLKQNFPIGEITTILEKLPNDPKLKTISENTGSVGSIINIILKIAEKIYEVAVPTDKRLSLILIRIMLESAKNSLPYVVSNTNIRDICRSKSNTFDVDFENIVLDLFDPKYHENIENVQTVVSTKISTMPDHPIFVKFKDLLIKSIKEINKTYEEDVINIPRFLTEFNSNVILQLEEETKRAEVNYELKNLLHKWQKHRDFEKMFVFLKNARNEYFKHNPIDKKSLSEYYVENKAYKVSKDTWELSEEQIKDKEEWQIDSFLMETNNSIEVIAAPYGIGKSSLARKISFDIANKFIENPVDSNAYLPVFVPLKYALEITCNGNKSLENDLKGIANSNNMKNETNILVILDGLDELSSSEPINHQTIYKTIQQEFLKTYPNSKYIITTRLETDFPKNLHITDHYIRLFSFGKHQIKHFFSNYGLRGTNSISNLSNNIYGALSELLTEEKIGKPLFCWMLATVYNNSTESQRKVLFDYSKKHNLSEVLLYQQFIHNIVVGKPKEEVGNEQLKKSKDEKKALRLLAFLIFDRPSITKNKIDIYLESFKYSLPTTATSLVSTYFSFNKKDGGTEVIEFAHKSFQEYLLAEFYLESIFTEKFHRLIGNQPTMETYYHLRNIINLLTSKDIEIIKSAKGFVRTFYEEDDSEENNLRNFNTIIRKNAMNYIKQKDLLPSLPPIEDLNIWNITRFGYKDLNKLWFSRWICLLIALNRQLNVSQIDDELLEPLSFFISSANRFVSDKILWDIQLRGIDLSYTDLPYVNLENAELVGANLSYTNFYNAVMSGTRLSNADLTGANLQNAYLSNADLTEADFTGADLSDTFLVSSNLSGANLSNTNLNRITLLRSNLSGINLSGANLSNSFLIDIEDIDGLQIDDLTTFKDTIIDSSALVDRIKGFKSITVITVDKEAFEETMSEAGFNAVFPLEYMKNTAFIITQG